MSCNGCRILRKGCNENCILRQSLLAIEGSQAQANATVFVAKFFGRAGLMSFLSSVPESQRPTLFQSLLFEACGRTVNPVNGAVGLLWTGNWHVCQSAVETVLKGGVLQALQECYELTESTKVDDGSEAKRRDLYASKDLNARFKIKRKGFDDGTSSDGSLGFAARMTAGVRLNRKGEKQRQDSPSDESETTTLESGFVCHQDLQQRQSHETKLLKLFF